MSHQTDFPIVGTSDVARTKFTDHGQLDKFQRQIDPPTRTPARPNQPSATAEVQIGTNGGYQYTKDFVNAWGHTIQTPRYGKWANQHIPATNFAVSAAATPVIQQFISQPQAGGRRQGQDVGDRRTYVFGAVFSLFPDRYSVPDVFVRVARILAQDTRSAPNTINFAPPPRVEQFQYDVSQPARYPGRGLVYFPGTNFAVTAQAIPTFVETWGFPNVVPARFPDRPGIGAPPGPYPFPAPGVAPSTIKLYFDIRTRQIYMQVTHPVTGLPVIKVMGSAVDLIQLFWRTAPTPPGGLTDITGIE